MPPTKSEGCPSNRHYLERLSVFPFSRRRAKPIRPKKTPTKRQSEHSATGASERKKLAVGQTAAIFDPMRLPEDLCSQIFPNELIAHVSLFQGYAGPFGANKHALRNIHLQAHKMENAGLVQRETFFNFENYRVSVFVFSENT